jgi:hypothetical protein
MPVAQGMDNYSFSQTKTLFVFIISAATCMQISNAIQTIKLQVEKPR